MLSVKNNDNIMNSEIPELFFNDIQKTSLAKFLIPVFKMKSIQDKRKSVIGKIQTENTKI